MHWCVYISVRESCEFVLARKEEMESRFKLGYSGAASTYTEIRSSEDYKRINGVSSSLLVVDFILILLEFGSTFYAAIVI